MTQAAVASQVGAFLADLRFVACLCALVLYAAWLGLRRPGLVGLARLGLVVGFGATVVAYGVSHVPFQALPFADFFLFMLLALFLILEFLFQMSVLGVIVAAVSTVIASLHYWWHAGPPAQPAVSIVQAYWWLLRDLSATTGIAALCLGMAAALLLYLQPDRRAGSKLVHPNDLRDVAALLSRASVPCFLFAGAFEVAGLSRSSFIFWSDMWNLGWLMAIVILSIAWWLVAEGRRFVGPRVLGIMGGNVLAIGAYCAERLIFINLTGGVRIP